MEELIKAFHLTWDAFPGVARLIGAGHEVLASNPQAIAEGLVPGQICAQIGPAIRHRGCLRSEALRTGEGQADNPTGARIRGWVPIEGYPEVVVHFSMPAPEAK